MAVITISLITGDMAHQCTVCKRPVPDPAWRVTGLKMSLVVCASKARVGSLAERADIAAALKAP